MRLRVNARPRETPSTSATATRRCATRGSRTSTTRARHSPSGAALRVLGGQLSGDRPPGRRSGPDAYVAISEAVRTADPAVLRPRRGGHSSARRRRATSTRLGEKEPGHFLWVHRLVAVQAPGRSRRSLPRHPASADDGRRRARSRPAAPASAAAERRAARVAPPRGARPTLRRGVRVSSTSARRTSGSRWSKRSRRARRSSRSTGAGRCDIVRHGRRRRARSPSPMWTRSAQPSTRSRAGIGTLRRSRRAAQGFSRERFVAAFRLELERSVSTEQPRIVLPAGVEWPQRALESDDARARSVAARVVPDVFGAIMTALLGLGRCGVLDPALGRLISRARSATPTTAC